MDIPDRIRLLRATMRDKKTVSPDEREALRNIVADVYNLGSDWEPALYQRTSRLLSNLNIQISYIKNRRVTKAPVSFSYRAMRGEYGIYIDRSADVPTWMIRDLFEKGHILFNHFNRPQNHRQQFEHFFTNNMSTILERLPTNLNIKAVAGLYSTYIYNRFSDIAQAMEINSKLFRDDWSTALAYLNRHKYFRELDAPVFTVSDALEMLERLKLKADEGKEAEDFIYPKETWPLGLDWVSYMSFLYMDSPFFLDAIGSGGERKIRSGDVTAYNNSREAEDQIQEQYETRMASLRPEQSGEGEDETVREGRSTGFSNARISREITECNDVEDLLRILRERSLYLRKSRLFEDLLYNVNRNKFDPDMLLPRRYRQENYTQNNVCILLDVSGSVPAAFIKRITGTIVQSEGVFDKRKSRLVSWSDNLCADRAITDIHSIPSGGGTILADGIEYCKRYLTESSSFFIISDFQDDLGEWLEAGRELPCRKTAIGYANVGRNVSFEEWFSRIGSNGDYRRSPVEPKEFCKVFDTVLIRGLRVRE
jgi:Mg-chelatase subunit ChlD